MNINQLNQQNQRIGLQAWYDQIRLGTKFVMVMPLVLFLIQQFFNAQLLYYLIDIPALVIHSFEIQRLFFAQFIEIGIFSIIISPLLFNSWVKVEEKLGTAVFIIDFFIKSFLIQVIFVFMTIIFQMTDQYSYGLWNVIFVYVTLDCLANPEVERRMMFFPCILKAKHFPIALLALGFLFTQRICYDEVAAGILALIEARFFNFMIFRPSQVYIYNNQRFVLKLENSAPFKYLKTRRDFALNQTDFYAGRAQVDEPTLPVQNQAVPWQGKGITIGTSEVENKYNYFKPSYQDEAYRQQ